MMNEEVVSLDTVDMVAVLSVRRGGAWPAKASLLKVKGDLPPC